MRSNKGDFPLLSRRRFVAGCAGLMAWDSADPGCPATAASSGGSAHVLSQYVASRDPSTAVELLGAGEALGGSWRTCRLTSQTWKDVAWVHELSMFMPAGVQDTGRMLLWIDGGGGKTVPVNPVTEPTKSVAILSAVANAAGLPAAVVRQVPFQPMFGKLREDGLIAHTFVEFTNTGDPSWPLLLPMVKSAVEAMTAATTEAREQWGVEVEEFVVAGASKRGWTTWLSAAVDERVTGIVPTVIDMLSLRKHVELQISSFGQLSEALHDYTSRGIEKLFSTARGRELCEIVDPYTYRDRYTMPKVIALGTNDPYWPLEACSLYYDGLPGPRWLSYCPNAGHGLPVLRVAALVAAVGRHVANLEPLPVIDWRFRETHDAAADCIVACDAKPQRVSFWTAASDSRDFRRARWTSQPVPGGDSTWQASFPRPTKGFSAGFIELEFDRAVAPLVLSSGVKVLRAP